MSDRQQSSDIKKSDTLEGSHSLDPSHLSFCRTIDEAMNSDLAHYLRKTIIVPHSAFLNKDLQVIDTIISFFADNITKS